jgi:putative acetyltransferase
VLIRRETPADIAEGRAIVGAAFRDPQTSAEPAEVVLLDRLRASREWIPALSLVAESPAAGPIEGHVVCTHAWVGDVKVLGLGPLAVRPDKQRRGVGSALMHAILGAAEALGTPAVGLLGSTAYYSRFGFRPGREVGVASPDPAWGDHFQVRLFVPALAAPRGRFRYAPPFEDMAS